jgi:hypothetical protein
MLASNSVVLMPPPRKETWLLEGQLKVKASMHRDTVTGHIVHQPPLDPAHPSITSGLGFAETHGSAHSSITPCVCVCVCVFVATCPQPWVHYVPLREDFADLWDKVMICEANVKWCAAIAKKATEYVSWFANEGRCVDRRVCVFCNGFSALFFKYTSPARGPSEEGLADPRAPCARCC